VQGASNVKTESTFIEMEECPSCHIPGSKKTFAKYTDGHGYCFYCSHYESGHILTVLERKSDEPETIKLPYDAQNEIPVKCLIWLAQYEISRQELLSHGIMYSESKDFLVFPYYGDDKQLVAWQGRDFKPNPKSKWYSKGPLEDVYKFCGDRSNRCVVVEDIVSAIKVGRFCQAMPIFGTNCKSRRLASLKLLGIDELIVWLDPDAAFKAFSITQEAKYYGIKSRMISALKDPKEHLNSEIKNILQL
jgi:hypothetical protein